MLLFLELHSLAIPR